MPTKDEFTIEVDGLDTVLRRLESFERRLTIDSLDTVERALIVLKTESQRLIISGFYRPAYQTGRLYDSIQTRITQFTFEKVTGVVETDDVYYAIYVHEGTIYMKARPFLEQALLNKELEVSMMFVDMVVDGIKRALV